MNLRRAGEAGRGRPPGPFLDPEVVPAEIHRRAARIVLVRDDGRVLVQRVRVPTDPAQGSWWELPGGGLDAGETTAAAAARELAEETGLVDVVVGPPVATRRVRYRGARRVAEQHETVHVARLRSDRRVPRRMGALEQEGLLEVAWRRPAELGGAARHDPAELPRLAQHAVDGTVVPWRLADVDLVGWSDESPSPQPLVDGARPCLVAGRVVRDAAPWTAAVHAWLRHCQDRGVQDVPAPLGVDVHGREAVTVVTGAVTREAGAVPGASAATRPGVALRPPAPREVDAPEDALPVGWWPEPLRTTDGLASVGRLLERLGAAAAGLSPARRVWRGGPATLAAGEVVCHGDVGHANLVWQPGGQAALIDWEFAHPGPPLRDLAEAACWLVPLVGFDHERRGFAAEPDRRARLRALATAGGTDVATLLAAVDHYLDAEVARVRRLGGLGIAPWDGFLAADQPAGFERVRTYLASHDLGA